jgi:three-Cys-motif partner protein
MSGGSEYRASKDDGLPARVSGAWAREKLAYLAKYMSIFNGGMKNKWDRVYLDLMAGPGRCVEDDTGAEFDGSPLLAVNQKVPFTEIVLVEGEPILAAALRRRVQSNALVVEADCNDPAVIEQLRDRLGSGRLGLAFADNLGLDVTLATLRSLTKTGKSTCASPFKSAI